MLSLLDLPDEALFNIGTYLEQDVHDLGLFLLIHPRINLLCYILRYRSRVVLLDKRAPLTQFLDHPLWLKHVHAIRITTSIAPPYNPAKLDKALKKQKRYDKQLAPVIASLENLREIFLESPPIPLVVRANSELSLKRTMVATKGHQEIRKIRISGFDSVGQLEKGLNLARSLPMCSSLELATFGAVGLHMDALSPLLAYISTPPALNTLKSLTLTELRLEARQHAQSLSALPSLPVLRHLSVLDNKYWNDQERQPEVDFLVALLRKASNISSLEILKPSMPGLARAGVLPSPVILHLECPRVAWDPKKTRWWASYPSVTSLTLSGPAAPGAAWSILDMDKDEPSYPFRNLGTLTLIDSIGWVNRPEYDNMAARQGIMLEVLEKCPDYSKSSWNS